MKRIFAFFMVLIMAISAVACVTEGPGSTPASTPEETPSESPTESKPAESGDPEYSSSTPVQTTSEKENALENGLVIVNEGKALFSLVLPSNEDDVYIMQAADKIANAVRYQSGTKLEKGTAEQEYEILIGDTGRKESTELKATLGADQYAVKLVGKKLVVVASSDIFLYDALASFTSTFFTPENAYAENGNCLILLNKDINIKENADKTSIRYLFSLSDNLYSDCGERLYNREAPSPTTGVQGGCAGGKYYFQGYILKDNASNEVNNKCIIVKFNRETGNPIKTSKVLDLNHTNDMTYRPETNDLVVCHNNPYRKKLTIIDANTLKVKETIEIQDTIFSLTYNAEKGMYCLGLAGGQNLRLYGSDFKRQNSTYTVATPLTKNYITQGICSDDNYIYCVLWDSKYKTENRPIDNVITVYDWYGNYVGMIHIDIGNIEPENLDIVDGVIYVVAAKNGASVFKVKDLTTSK